MGTNCVHYITMNHGLRPYLKKDHSNHTVISLFNNHCRYLDVILTVNNPTFRSFVKELHP